MHAIHKTKTVIDCKAECTERLRTNLQLLHNANSEWNNGLFQINILNVVNAAAVCSNHDIL